MASWKNWLAIVSLVCSGLGSDPVPSHPVLLVPQQVLLEAEGTAESGAAGH